MQELYFIRHGQTEWNAIRRMQGRWNSDLNELGRRQADANGRFLAGCDIDYVVASPLDRTRQTADIINGHLGLTINYDDRIMEWDCGDWSGEVQEDVSKSEEWATWRADPFTYRPPNAENYEDMIERATPFLEELTATPHKRVAVVSHGMIGRVMVGVLMKLSRDELLDFHQQNDTIFHLTDRGEYYVTQHFVGGEGPYPGIPKRDF